MRFTPYKVDYDLLVDTGLENNLVPDNYFTLWDLIAEWQVMVLSERGIRTSSYLLDIGCGAMRLGFSAVNYLDSGHYFGMDPYSPYVETAKAMAAKLKIQKEFHLSNRSDFGFGLFNHKFDYAMAQSVVTHLSWAQFRACLLELKKVMNSGAQFIFTYSIGYYPTVGFMYGGSHVMKRPWIRDIQQIKNLAAELKIDFQTLEFKHPTGQLVGIFCF